MPPIPPKANSQLIAETLDLCSMVSENVAQAERTVGRIRETIARSRVIIARLSRPES